MLANDDIGLELRRGEILTLLGENGAGKSTLMNILYGLYFPDEGEIRIAGREVRLAGPKDAIENGIGMVHQHFQLVSDMTVTENVMLGAETQYGPGILDRAKARETVTKLSKDYGLHVDADSIIEELPVGVQQRVEIIKALYRKANILILDEPTAVLTPQEIEDLFGIMHGLQNEGKSVIFISHKLKEVLHISNRILVMRQGRIVGDALPEDSTEQSLASLMVGREVILTVNKKPAQPKKTVLEVKDLSCLDDRLHLAVDRVSFAVRAGEIFGIAGIQGNGQTELAEVLTGLRTPSDGQVTLNGKTLKKASPRLLLEEGMAHIPENRHRFGMISGMSIAKNMALNTYFRPPFAQGIRIREKAIRENAENLVAEFDVRTPTVETATGNLSGGNQQKVVVAREFSRPLELLIARHRCGLHRIHPQPNRGAPGCGRGGAAL